MDRFYDSTFVYQGYAGKLNLDDIKTITDFAISGTVPDLTFVLDISYDESMKRKMGDEALKNLDRMESKGRQYHERVREGYLDLADKNKNRIVVIDGSQSIEAVHKQIVKEFETRYKKVEI